MNNELIVRPQNDHSENGLVESGFMPDPNTHCDVSLRRIMPPSQFRSLGGSLDYGGWSERERFMELDRALQREPQQKHDEGGQACPDDPQEIPVMEERDPGVRPLRLAAKYRRIGGPFAENILTEGVNISSKGLLFKASHESLLPGHVIEVFIDWPVRLDNCVPLSLVVEGPVVRRAGELTAMRIGKYEFRPRCVTPTADPGASSAAHCVNPTTACLLAA
jgi:hypothetical protein